MSYKLKDIGGFEGRYSISPDGRLWSHLRNHWLEGSLDPDGYRYYRIRKEGKSFHVRGAVVVLETFVGPRPEGQEADHKNKIRHDDRLDNLRWLCATKNKQRTRQNHQGVNNPRSFLTEARVLEIRATYKNTNTSHSQLAREFGLRQSQITDVLLGRTWSHLPV